MAPARSYTAKAAYGQGKKWIGTDKKMNQLIGGNIVVYIYIYTYKYTIVSVYSNCQGLWLHVSCIPTPLINTLGRELRFPWESWNLWWRYPLYNLMQHRDWWRHASLYPPLCQTASEYVAEMKEQEEVWGRWFFIIHDLTYFFKGKVLIMIYAFWLNCLSQKSWKDICPVPNPPLLYVLGCLARFDECVVGASEPRVTLFSCLEEHTNH